MKQLTITQSITNRESANFNRYLSDIAKMPLLSPDEEVELARRIKEGDEEALKKLVVSNLRFVVSTAKNYQNYGLDLQDLVNEGNIGLIEAARRFDETKGFKFITYAVNWIRQSIMQYVAKNMQSIRIPVNQQLELSKIKSARARLEFSLHREPTVEELAEEVDLPVEKVSNLLTISARIQSVDAPLTQEEDSTLKDVLVWNNAEDTNRIIERQSLEIEIQGLLSALPERESKVLMMLFGINSSHEYTVAEVGDELSLSRERVRQIRERALLHLRQNAKSENLKSYM